MSAPSVVTVETWQLLTFFAGLLGSFFAVVFGVAKFLLKQLDERNEERDANIKKVGDKVDQVERDILTLRAELPSNYVQREDWIRFSGTIDAKLDWLRDKSDRVGTELATLKGMLKREGKNDGR